MCFIYSFDQPDRQLFVQKYGVPIHNFTWKWTRGMNCLKISLQKCEVYLYNFKHSIISVYEE